MPEERAATPEEVQDAINSLSLADWGRLRRYADYYIKLLGERAGDRRGDDLLQVAFERLLRRSRKWDKTKVRFLNLMYGAVRSVSDSWRKKTFNPTEEAAPAYSLVEEREEGEVSDPAEEFVTRDVDPAQALVYKETLEQIDGLFTDDQEVQQVLESLRDGYDAAGTRELWGLGQREYNTIIVRMRRRIERAGIVNPIEGKRYVQ